MHVDGVESGLHGFNATLYTEYRFNGTHVTGVKSVLFNRGPSPLKEGRLFEEPSILWV